jgi:hypothetical protein
VIMSFSSISFYRLKDQNHGYQFDCPIMTDACGAPKGGKGMEETNLGVSRCYFSWLSMDDTSPHS